MIATPTPRKPRRGDYEPRRHEYVTVVLLPPAEQTISGPVQQIVDVVGVRYYVVWWCWQKALAVIPDWRVDQIWPLPKAFPHVGA